MTRLISVTFSLSSDVSKEDLEILTKNPVPEKITGETINMTKL